MMNLTQLFLLSLERAPKLMMNLITTIPTSLVMLKLSILTMSKTLLLIHMKTLITICLSTDKCIPHMIKTLIIDQTRIIVTILMLNSNNASFLTRLITIPFQMVKI